MEILDIEEEEITPETYVVRELDAESIDLLELAVELNAKFNIDINDDDIFLKTLRLYLAEAREAKKNPAQLLALKYPHISPARIKEILKDLEDGPVLKVKDLRDYVAHIIKDSVNSS